MNGSLFPAGDTDVLAERIDWWLEHPEERREMELRYAEHAKQYTLEHSIQQTEEMFRMADPGAERVMKRSGAKNHIHMSSPAARRHRRRGVCIV